MSRGSLYIGQGEQPLSEVDDLGVRCLLCQLEPRSEVPSRHHNTDTVLAKLHVCVKLVFIREPGPHSGKRGFEIVLKSNTRSTSVYDSFCYICVCAAVKL